MGQRSNPVLIFAGMHTVPLRALVLSLPRHASTRCDAAPLAHLSSALRVSSCPPDSPSGSPPAPTPWRPATFAARRG